MKNNKVKKHLILLAYFLISIYSSAQEHKGLFKFEDYNSIKDYLNTSELNYNETDLFIFKNFESFVKYNGDGFLKGPIVHVFNPDGLYLESIEPNEAILKLTEFKKIKNKPKKDAINLIDWLSGLVNVKSLEPIKKEEDKDFYFVLNWAVFFNQPCDGLV